MAGYEQAFICFVVGGVGAALSLIFFWGLHEKIQSDKMPKFRVVPTTCGKYTIEKWNSVVREYWAIEITESEEEAEKVIKHISQKTKYYHGE